MKEGNKKVTILAGLLFGLGGWISWLLFFWYMLIDGNPHGYYINPYLYNEFWFEFILLHIFLILSIVVFLKMLKSIDYLKTN